ncbi:hypothetical protein KUTeg_012150 [Tegillarca granosa]|uniref:Uncharacterized protein n=1 Tax=Tegillarca granosa TaxID=220873 RepID=A0ABQ9F284_TEGGR|nr:hypothetical protein KUTeg_012150 [Tegillarca granosa]
MSEKNCKHNVWKPTLYMQLLNTYNLDPNRAPGEVSVNEWPVHTHNERLYLELNTKYLHASEMPNAIGVGPRIQECAFWRNYLPNLVDATEYVSLMISITSM